MSHVPGEFIELVVHIFAFIFSGALRLSLVNCFYLSVRRGRPIWAKKAFEGLFLLVDICGRTEPFKRPSRGEGH